jgi:hypothetical protein
MPDTILMTVGMSAIWGFYLKELVLLESDQEAIEVHSIPAVSDVSFFFSHERSLRCFSSWNVGALPTIESKDLFYRNLS